MVSMKILQLLYSYILEQMNHFPPFPANRGSSRLTGGASLQQGGSNFKLRHMRGDNMKLRAKRAQLQQTNLWSRQPVQQAVSHTGGR